MKNKPLVITLGNEARGDDGIGLAVFEQLQQSEQINAVDALHVTQLQPEHIELLQQRNAVLIVDAALAQSQSIEFKRIEPHFTHYVSSHVVPPEILLGWYQQLIETPGPDCYLLSVRGEQFELGEALSETVKKALPTIIDTIKNWILHVSAC